MGGRFVTAELGTVFAYLWLFKPKLKLLGHEPFSSTKSFLCHLPPTDNLGSS